MKRRDFLVGLCAGTAVASLLAAHTLYGQWVVYRRKHLLTGRRREDMSTYEAAQAVAAALDHASPSA